MKNIRGPGIPFHGMGDGWRRVGGGGKTGAETYGEMEFGTDNGISWEENGIRGTRR